VICARFYPAKSFPIADQTFAQNALEMFEIDRDGIDDMNKKFKSHWSKLQ
jgi:hypothetical protein